MTLTPFLRTVPAATMLRTALSVAALAVSLPLTAQVSPDGIQPDADSLPISSVSATRPDPCSFGGTSSIACPVRSAIAVERTRAVTDGGSTFTARVEPFSLLPDSPTAASESSSSAPVFGPQQSGKASAPATQNAPDQPSKRILGIVPNYRAVGVGAKLPPQPIKEKFVTASEDTFDYSALALAVLVAGYSDATNATPEFKSGGNGGVTFSRYLWHSAVDQSIENYSVEFIVPVLTHEDTRFYTLGSGGFKKRTIYALTRLVITRSDSGHETVNLSELLGAGLGAGISNLYYPRPERTVGQTLGKYGTSLGIDAASYFIREFDTEISRVLSPKHKAPTADATK